MNELSVTSSYEVWRTHMRGGTDVCVGRDMTEGGARSLRGESDEWTPACSFYLVRVTTTRDRVTEPLAECVPFRNGYGDQVDCQTHGRPWGCCE